jgi:starch synthase
MRIVMASAECAPYVKVGGLADVVGALPAALAALGCRVEVVLPAYGSIDRARYGFAKDGAVDATWAGQRARAELLQLERDDGVTITLVHEPAAFDRAGVYDDPRTKEGYTDNPERFAFFARTVAERVVRNPPDVLHLHDSHVALVPGMLKTFLAPRAPIPTLLTIHNIAHQTRCLPRTLFAAGFPESMFHAMSPLEFHGSGNFLKTGIVFADAVSTVSEHYAREIQTTEFGAGLEGVLGERRNRLFGILNGIDTDVWDPETDPHLPRNYSARDLRGKAACRARLLEDFGMQAGADAPVIGMVGRLVEQKGLDLVIAAADELVAMDVRLIVLGSGQDKYQRVLQRMHDLRPDRFAVYFGFDERLAHQIEAGADFFLMPSRFEPCGLNQMYSQRYGTVPIVRATGGLVDTVVDADADPANGTGLVFGPPDPRALLERVRAASALFRDKPRLRAVRLRGMARDFSWRRSAARYVDLYRRIAR